MSARKLLQFRADSKLIQDFLALAKTMGISNRADAFDRLVHEAAAIRKLMDGGKTISLRMIHGVLVVSENPVD